MSAALKDIIERVKAAPHGFYVLDGDIAVAVRQNDAPPKPYTVSLEAALRLVPEGWHWEIGSKPIWAKVWRGGETFAANHYEAKTVELALCLVSLRARLFDEETRIARD